MSNTTALDKGIMVVLRVFVDLHLIYATALVDLIAHNAGQVWGFDGLLERLHVVERHPALRPLVG